MCEAITTLIEEGKMKGLEQGKIQFVLEILAELGAVPNDLEENIKKEKDIYRLKSCMKAAVTSNSIEEFRAITGK